MKVVFHKKFQKDLAKIREDSVLRDFFEWVSLLEAVKSLVDLGGIKRLRPAQKKCFRYKLGAYRIGFTVVGNQICLERILHRKDIYKYFP